MGLFELLAGGAVLILLLPVLLKYYTEFMTAIGIQEAGLSEFGTNIENVIETIITLPMHVLGVAGTTVYNMIPNISVVIVIMIIVVIMVALKIWGLITNGS